MATLKLMKYYFRIKMKTIETHRNELSAKNCQFYVNLSQLNKRQFP